jgi:hypothetical protein
MSAVEFGTAHQACPSGDVAVGDADMKARQGGILMQGCDHYQNDIDVYSGAE